MFKLHTSVLILTIHTPKAFFYDFTSVAYLKVMLVNLQKKNKKYRYKTSACLL